MTDELWKGLKKALDGAVDGFVDDKDCRGRTSERRYSCKA